MGVHGLFDVLRDHSQRRSLKRMAHDAFADTRGKHRALRLGIDAAIWLVHSQWGKSGANPMVRSDSRRGTSAEPSPSMVPLAAPA